jgi:hypothetical protein
MGGRSHSTTGKVCQFSCVNGQVFWGDGVPGKGAVSPVLAQRFGSSPQLPAFAALQSSRSLQL